MKVVSNTSPLIFLSKLNELNLLSCCFDEVCIPEAVKIEIGTQPLPDFVQIHSISEFGKHYVEGSLFKDFLNRLGK